MRMRNEIDEVESIKRIAKIVVTAIVVLTIFFGSFYTIPAGHRGVMLTFGKPDLVERGEGFGFKIPIAQQVAKLSVQTQKYEAGASASSADLQVVTTDIATNYHLNPEMTAEIYQSIGAGYRDRVIQPAVQEVVKSVTARFTAEQLITNRSNVKLAIQTELQERLRDRNIVVEEISVTNFKFSAEFDAAIEAKVTAEQNALKAERDLQRIEVEARQAKAQAQGQRDAKIANAEGEARAIEMIEKQLSKSPRYIEYIKAQKWDGVLPRVTGGAVPFVDVYTVE